MLEWQLIEFAMFRQDDGVDAVTKYILCKHDDETFGVLIQKYVMKDGNMLFEEQCESQHKYNRLDALSFAKLCSIHKVLPSTYLEIEADLRASNLVL